MSLRSVEIQPGIAHRIERRLCFAARDGHVEHVCEAGVGDDELL